MAHASCFNNHGLWDGDGTPSVWAYRVNFFREFIPARETIHHDKVIISPSHYETFRKSVFQFPCSIRGRRN